MQWTDSHNHLQFLPPDEVAAVMAAMAAAGVARAVVNATSEADWPAVATLAERWPDRIVPAFGIHPAWAGGVAEGWQGRLREMLENHPLAGVGECGLDRRPGQAGVALQRSVLEDQVRLARDLGRTTTIHCVRAWGEWLAALAAIGPPGKFLLHSFNGSPEIASRLIPLGAYFSISPNQWERGGQQMRDTFRQLPRERLLLESDAPQRPGQSAAAGRDPATLPATGALLAEGLGISVADLAELTTANARACFGW